MLDAHMEEEQVTYKCPYCENVDARSQTHLWSSSDVLIVHLKRTITSKSGVERRINTHVGVPLDVVDFSPWFAPTSPSRDGSNYRLYAVANHVGE
jgi:hypothetical protein